MFNRSLIALAVVAAFTLPAQAGPTAVDAPGAAPGPASFEVAWGSKKSSPRPSRTTKPARSGSGSGGLFKGWFGGGTTATASRKPSYKATPLPEKNDPTKIYPVSMHRQSKVTHQIDCRYVVQAEGKGYSRMGIAEAKRKGGKPCKVCWRKGQWKKPLGR